MRPSDAICPVSGETALEERLNTFTHMVGMVFSVVGCFILFLKAGTGGNFHDFAACLIYGTTLFVLYTVSTCYHACVEVPKKRHFQVTDHICIYLLIAGTYTPFTLGPLKSLGGWSLFYIVWSIALGGVIFKILAKDRFKVVSVLAYILMGWLVMFMLPQLLETLHPTSLQWLFAGGLAYTSGTLFYIWDSLPYNHAIWHLFVLCGSFCHFLCILSFI